MQRVSEVKGVIGREKEIRDLVGYINAPRANVDTNPRAPFQPTNSRVKVHKQLSEKKREKEGEVLQDNGIIHILSRYHFLCMYKIVISLHLPLGQY